MKNQTICYLIYGLIFFGLLSCNSNQSSEQSNTTESSDSKTTGNKIDIPPLSDIPEIKTEEYPIETPHSLISDGPFATKSTVNNSADVRLNPAHGQPGHDCAIAVGAPLKNAVSPAPAPLNLSTPIALPVEAKPVAAPAPVASPSFSANANAKLNPAHGQPGHDCAVAVGAPLPLK